MDFDDIRELFIAFGAVSVRRMFGGAGLYADGVMFALVSGGQIYLKVNEKTVPDYQREGCGPFEYDTKVGKRTISSYWRLPDRLYDDPDELARWARFALTIAHSGAAARPRRRQKSSRKMC